MLFVTRRWQRHIVYRFSSTTFQQFPRQAPFHSIPYRFPSLSHTPIPVVCCCCFFFLLVCWHILVKWLKKATCTFRFSFLLLALIEIIVNWFCCYLLLNLIKTRRFGVFFQLFFLLGFRFCSWSDRDGRRTTDDDGDVSWSARA